MKKSLQTTVYAVLLSLCLAITMFLFGCGNTAGGGIASETDTAVTAVTQDNLSAQNGAQTTGAVPAPKIDTAAAEAILAQEISGEITISCYYDNSFFLNEIIKAFEAKHTGVKVNIEKFDLRVTEIYAQTDEGYTVGKITSDDGDQPQLDYIQRFNTEMMSGGGADILTIDIIPWYRYADSGYLEDLRQLMEEDVDFNKDDMRMNILDAVSYKGGIYIFPLNGSFNFFAYDSSLFNDNERALLSAKGAFTFSELINIADNAFERNNKENRMFGRTGGKYQPYSIIAPLLAENYGYFVDIENKQARFDDGVFENFLLSVKEYCEKGYINETSEVIEMWMSDSRTSFSMNENPNPNERFFYKYFYNDSLYRQFDKHYAELNQNLAGSIDPTVGNDENDVVAALAADFNGNALFTPGFTYALNSNSKNKRLAWEFIKFLASPEIQSQSNIYGFQINRRALDTQVMEYIGGPDGVFIKQFEGDFKDHEDAIKDYIACLDKFSDSLSACVIHDERIDWWIEEELIQYFGGKKSAKDVAAALQNKVRLYLNE